MRRVTCMIPLWLFGLVLAASAGAPASAIAAADDGFVAIFDGKSLDGWDGNTQFWRAEDGCIVGETTADNPTKGNTFIIWRGGKPADFELKMQCKLVNHNSGIQFRSFEVPDDKWVVGGYQSDMDGSGTFFGILYGERYRGILCQRGQKTVIGEDHKPKEVGKVGDSAELLSKIKLGDWNEYHIVAQGNHIYHEINGQVMIDVVDEDKEMARGDGIIALQLHAGPPMKVFFRNIRLKEIKKVQPMKGEAVTKKIVLIAGRPSHGYGGHEHNAGCRLLAKALGDSGLGIETVVYENGWPKEDGALDGAASIVMFCDGGGGHVVMPHLAEVDKLAKKGIGIACLHYGVEVPKGEAGDYVKDWIGGYFETFWSVNPHWLAQFKQLPNHPVANGVKPFWMDDEWYYHMRFVDNMEGVTPILQTVPPESTRQRPDDAHGGNPVVRSRTGMSEIVAWARQRADGGRGFGFTGCHWHWSWANDNFRKVVLNGIAWTAGVEIPADGVPSKAPTFEELETNQDEPQPANFDRQRIQTLIEQWKTEPSPPK